MRKLTPAILLALLLSTSAWAQGPGPRGQMNPGSSGFRAQMICPAAVLTLPARFMLDSPQNPLQLSDEQKQKLTKVYGNSDTKLASLRESARQSADALRKALFDSTRDAAALRQLTDAAAKSEAALTTAELDAWLQIRGILTADQLTTLSTARPGPRMGPPGPGAPGMGGPGGPGAPGGAPEVPPPPPVQ